MPSFALTLGEVTLGAAKLSTLPLCPAFHPIAFDPQFRGLSAGDKIVVDWKTHALTFAADRVGGL